MKPSQMQIFDVNKVASYGFYKLTLTAKSFCGLKHSRELKRNIPCIYNSGMGGVDSDKIGISDSLSLREIDGIKFFISQSELKDTRPRHINVYTKAKHARKLYTILKKYGHNDYRIYKEQISKQNFSDHLNFIDYLYINQNTKDKIKDALQKFVFANKANQILTGYTKNMSIVFSGAPGDGKTYNANRICKRISELTNSTLVRDTVTTFSLACKKVRNIVALLDDITTSHMNRETNPDICTSILSEMDAPNCSRLFLLTTNESLNPETIDKAFFRNGRIECIIPFEKPDENVKTRFLLDSMVTILENRHLKESSGLLTKEILTGIQYYAEELTDGISFAELVSFRNSIVENVLLKKSVDLKSCLSKSRNIIIPEEVLTNDL